MFPKTENQGIKYLINTANILNLHEGRKGMFYLTTHSIHFIYGYMASDIWLRTNLIAREETRYRHIGYSFRLTARVLLYAPSHRQDSTYHILCYTSRGADLEMLSLSLFLFYPKSNFSSNRHITFLLFFLLPWQHTNNSPRNNLIINIILYISICFFLIYLLYFMIFLLLFFLELQSRTKDSKQFNCINVYS